MVVFPFGKIDGKKPAGFRNIKSAVVSHGKILYPNDAPPDVGTSYLADDHTTNSLTVVSTSRIHGVLKASRVLSFKALSIQSVLFDNCTAQAVRFTPSQRT